MAEVYSICPKCSHTRKKKDVKCMSTNTETGLFKCHHPHCDNQGIVEGGKYISKGMAKKKIDLFVPADIESKFVSWLHKRGISQNTILRNKVRSKGNEIMFPYYKDGEPVNIKYRNINEKKFRQEKGAEKIFYGLDDIKGRTEIIIVEGEIDKLSLEEAGFENVISVPAGAPSLTAKHYESEFEYLENCEEWIKDVIKIVVAVDNDTAGYKLGAELIRRLGAERCWVVVYPEGCKDPNEVLVKKSAYDLALMIEEARPVPIEGLFEQNDIAEKLRRSFEYEDVGGKDTGWFSLNDYYSVREGETTIITGVPSHGKSEFIDALMINLAKNHEWRFGVFSPENYPLHYHTAKLIQKYIEKPFNKAYNNHMTKEEMEQGLAWLQNKFYYVMPPEEEMSVNGILNKAKVAVYRYGIKGLCIDPWNEVDHSRPSGKSETEHISECLAKIRWFARNHRVHVWIIAHPTKLYRDKDGKYPVPTPYDISGSAHFRNKADNCITVWRDLSDDSKAVEVHIQKIRFKEIGKIGMVEMKYNYKSGGYLDTQF